MITTGWIEASKVHFKNIGKIGISTLLFVYIIQTFLIDLSISDNFIKWPIFFSHLAACLVLIVQLLLCKVYWNRDTTKPIIFFLTVVCSCIQSYSATLHSNPTLFYGFLVTFIGLYVMNLQPGYAISGLTLSFVCQLPFLIEASKSVPNGNLKVYGYFIIFLGLLRLIGQNYHLRLRNHVSNYERNLAKSAIEKLNSAIIQKEKLASLGIVASSIAHQIGNHLNGISVARFALSRITYPEETNSKVKSLLESISRNIKYSKMVIESINTFGSGNDPLGYHKLSEMVDSAEYIIKGKVLESVKIEHRKDESIEVYCKKNTIIQAIINILSNAVDASEKNGKITVSHRLENKRTLIEISDNGHGIPEEIQEDIFEPFKSSKTSDKGTGLGLFISKKEIENNEGTVSFRTSKNGTTFIIELNGR